MSNIRIFALSKQKNQNIMKAIQLKQVSKGCLFHLSDSETSPLWVRSVYEPHSKKYEIYSYDNVNFFRYRAGSLIVYVEE